MEMFSSPLTLFVFITDPSPLLLFRVNVAVCSERYMDTNTLEQYTVERRLSERQSSETSNIRTHIFFVLHSNNENSAITSRNKVLCHFY